MVDQLLAGVDRARLPPLASSSRASAYAAMASCRERISPQVSSPSPS
jgi:hypothetical protein